MSTSSIRSEIEDKMSTAISILQWEMGNGWGHVATRNPDGNRFLLRHVRPPLDAKVPDDVLEYDLDGKLLSGERDLPQEIYFYSVPLKAKKNLNAVIHCHPPAAIALASVGQKIIPLHQDAIRFGKGIPIAPWLYGSLRDHADRAFKMMANNCALMIKGHGAIVTGDTLEEACLNMVHLERTAKMILMASALGKVQRLSDSEIRQFEFVVHGVKQKESRKEPLSTRNPGRKEWRYFETMVKNGQRWTTL
jgi:ribulose-5-phosphate 4-epimerase/fuculose-1-phosphate aldolase